VHLAPLVRELGIEVWSDERIRAGDDWRTEIAAALDRASIAILLVSADFLASEFIASDELPGLVSAASDRYRGTTIRPLIVSPSRFGGSSLSRFQAVNDPDRPPVTVDRGQQERTLDCLSSRIESQLQGEPTILAPGADGADSGLMLAANREVFSKARLASSATDRGNGRPTVGRFKERGCITSSSTSTSGLLRGDDCAPPRDRADRPIVPA